MTNLYNSALPGTPVPMVVDSTKSTITLKWMQPEGSAKLKIKGYIVEMKQEGKCWYVRNNIMLIFNIILGSDEWKKVTSHELRSLEFVIPNLKHGQKYNFRVTAVNPTGYGEPGEVPGLITVEERLGIIIHYNYSYHTSIY